MIPEPEHLDELASAYVDNELSPTERAAVEADPAALARVRIFESVRTAVTAPAASGPTDGQREQALRVALASADEAVTPLVARRARRWQVGAGLGVAAAVIALAVAFVAAFGNSDGGGSKSAAVSAATGTSIASSAGAGQPSAAANTAPLAPNHQSASAPASPPAGAAQSGTSEAASATGALPQLGDFSDSASLSSHSQSLTLSPLAPAACDGRVLATLSWNGEPARLVERSDNTRVVVAPDCFLLAFVPRSVPVPAR